MPYGTLAAIGASLASTALNQQLNERNREADFENWQLGRQQSYADSQRAQINAPMNTKIGMMAAGLSPLLGAPAPSAQTPTPMQNTKAPNLDIAQSMNLVADAKLKEQQAQNVQLQNDNMEGENESSLENYITQMSSLSSLYKQRGWNSMAEGIDEDIARINELKSKGELKFNAGSLRGAVNAFGTAEAMQKRLTNTFENLMNTEANYRMMVNGSAISLSKMPKLQKDLLATQISNNIATHSLLLSQKNLTDEQKNELMKLQEKFQAEIDKLVEEKRLTEYQANQIRYADWKQLFQDGEFMAAVMAKVDEQQKIILQQMGQFANAVVTAKTGGRIANSIDKVNKSKTTSSQQSSTYHYGPDGKLKGFDVNNSSGTGSKLQRSIPTWNSSEW